jgi:predicted dinucleotide-binding enzyme
MFTRGGADLASTAIFIGGSDVAAAEAVAARVRETFFGPVRVGVLLDPAGANTTAAAAVVAAARHLPLRPGEKPQPRALVLGGTGPVGQRVARLLAGRGADVTVASRTLRRAEEIVARITATLPQAAVSAVEWTGSLQPDTALARLVEQLDLIVAAGAAGVKLLNASGRAVARSVKVIIDLNAVPPAGIEGVVATDKARSDGAAVVYGALGVGGTKMKIHKAAIGRIFTQPEAFLDAEELLAIGEQS